MYSIGALSRQSGVKVPTIRYYEDRGLLPEAERTAGGQRRYNADGLSRLRFIKHARDLGFSIEAITGLLQLQEHPDTSCQSAQTIALDQLPEVRLKIAHLSALERELARITDGCNGTGTTKNCYVMTSLSDHDLCAGDH